MQIGFKVGVGARGRGRGRKVAPVNLALPLLSQAAIGSTTTVSLGQWKNADGLSADILVDGTIRAADVSEGDAVLLTPADDLTDFVLRVRAFGTGGTEATALSSPLAVRYVPPAATGTVQDEIFDADDGEQSIAVAPYFSGDDLRFAVTGFGASIDPATGVVGIDTTLSNGGEVITVSATNSGGTAEQVFLVTVEDEGPVGAPITIYKNTFQVDRSSDFLAVSTASLSHDPGIGDGAMTFGAIGESNSSAIIYLSSFDVDVAPIVDGSIRRGRTYQVLLRTALTGSGSNIDETSVRLQDAGGTTLWYSGKIGTGTNLLTIPAQPGIGELRLRIDMKIRGDITRNRVYEIRELGVWDITESGGFPSRAELDPFFWTLDLSENVASDPIEFGPYFDGPVTSYEYDGPEPHVWNGSELTITPSIGQNTEAGPDEGQVIRKVTALNGSLESINAHGFKIKVRDGDPPLTNRDSDIAWTLEVNRPFTFSMQRQVYGGSNPHSYEVVSKPPWVTVESNGHCWGYAPATPQATENLVIRTTDAAGATLNTTMPITVIATRDRTNPVDVPSGEITTFMRGYTGAGTVFRLLAANSYTWGNGYQCVTQPADDPHILIGENQSVEVEGSVNFKLCAGLIIEGFTVSREVTSGNSKGERATTNILDMEASRFIFLYDMISHGNRLAVDPVADPDDAGNWLNSEPFVTMCVGLTLSGYFCVAHDCEVYDVYAGFNINSGRHFGVFDCLVRDFGIDGITITTSVGGIVRGNTFRDMVGNYTNSTHRDLIQTFANNTPMPRAFCFIDNFASCSGVDDIQGHLLDLDGIARTDGTPQSGTNYRHIHRGNAVFASTDGHGFQYENFKEGVFDHMCVVNHPDVNKLAPVNMRKASEMAFSNSIVKKFNGGSPDTVFNGWKHLCTFANIEDLSVSGTALPDIFPNWNTTGLTYECPREAVANGQPASTARMWIDPASAWGVANPDIGPTWLRTG